ncbi:MAG: hypothetical protein NTZ18_04820 [Candidatus Komeilibacteria bacterium]|nr:hypothetical protein [Candidatus Komeilibacteria bacterium]
MGRRSFTIEQIKRLAKNKNVSRCGATSVRYKGSFKESALRQYNDEGLGAVEIFETAGFDLTAIGKRAPNRLMNQWNTAFRPRRTHEPPLNDQVKTELTAKRTSNGREIKTLKAKVAYLEAENDFLAQLRAKKRKQSLSHFRNFK